jgi:hypothetical protein
MHPAMALRGYHQLCEPQAAESSMFCPISFGEDPPTLDMIQRIELPPNLCRVYIRPRHSSRALTAPPNDVRFHLE